MFEINRHVQSQKKARSLKFRTKEEEALYYARTCSENIGVEQVSVFVFAKVCTPAHFIKLSEPGEISAERTHLNIYVQMRF